MALLWGGNTVAVKIGLAGIPPLALAGIRFFLGGATVLVWAVAAKHGLGLEREHRVPLGLLAALFLVQIACLNFGVKYTLASRSALFLATYPFWTALLAHFFVPGERLQPHTAAGLALAFSGLILLFGEGLLTHVGSPVGDGFALASGFLLGVRMVYTKRLTAGVHPIKLLVWQSALSVPAFLLLSLLFEHPSAPVLTLTVSGAILYQGIVVAGLCFIIQTTLIHRYSPSVVTAFGFATPVFGVLFSALILGEPVTPALLASLVLVAIGITVVNRSPRGRPAPASE
jgi:drug/metabolite transporter (DMT)-like permease